MDKQRKNLLVFGYGLAVILTFIGTRLGIKHGWSFLPCVLIAAAVCFAYLSRFGLDLLKPIYSGWMKVAHLIGEIITTIILSLLFFTMFGLVGIILRIIRKDLLDRKIETSRDSYWINREPEDFDKKNYLRQF